MISNRTNVIASLSIISSLLEKTCLNMRAKCNHSSYHHAWPERRLTLILNMRGDLYNADTMQNERSTAALDNNWNDWHGN